MRATIRDAVLEDAADIATIYNQSVRETTATFDTLPQSVEAREAWLISHGPRHPVLIAEDGGRVLGWASLSAWSDRPAYARTCEVSVYVDENAQGEGIGRALMTDIIERARLVGMHVLISRISSENEVSLRMTRGFGFTDVGVMHEVGEKFGRLIDVVILELLL